MDKVYSIYNSYAASSAPIYSYCPISTQPNENTQVSVSEINEMKPIFSGDQTDDQKKETNGDGSSDKTSDMQSIHTSNAANHIVPRIVQVYQTTVTNSIKIQNSQIIQLLPTPQTPQENIVYKQTLQQSLPQFSNVQLISQALQPQPVLQTPSDQLAEQAQHMESTEALTSQSSIQSQAIASDQPFQPQQIIYTATNPLPQSFQENQATQPVTSEQLVSQQTSSQEQSEQNLIHIGDLQQQTQPSFQLTQHVLVPKFYKQQMEGFQAQPYYEYQTGVFQKNPAHFVIAKIEPDIQVTSTNQIECKTEPLSQKETNNQKEAVSQKRSRSKVSNPNNWACNVRKVKHQRGEAYISRRGKFVPERRVKNMKDCLKSCKLKCNENINDTDREHIFKAFYSLNANEKKHFLLNTTERMHTKRLSKHKIDHEPRRKYSFKYFFLVRAVRYTVCKNFYLGTLAISQKPVYNVHLGKSDVNIPKPDGRGLSEASVHSLSSELKDRVRKHIMSFRTINSKPVRPKSKKKQLLDSKLSVKKMYLMYLNQCNSENQTSVKESMYRKILSTEFNLHFKKEKSVFCDRCKATITKK